MDIRKYCFFCIQIWDRLRSRKFTTIVGLCIFLILYLLYKYATYPVKYGFDKSNLNDCLKEKLSKYANSIDNMNTVVTAVPTNDDDLNEIYVPFTGNGYVGISVNSKQGIYAYHQKSLNLPLNYNPLTSAYLDNTWQKHEATLIEMVPGLAHKVQCFLNDYNECITVTNTLFAHRTRPSLVIEEISFNNPTKETVTFDIIQIGAIEWNKKNFKTETYNNHEYTVTSGIINVKSDGKDKQVCLAIISTKLPTTIQLKSHDLNARYSTMTVVKYSKTLLNTKPDVLKSTVDDIEGQALIEFKNSVDIGAYKLKQEHINAWTNIWKSGFSISKSLASNTLNGNQINSTIYYVLCSNRAPLLEFQQHNNTNEINTLNELTTQVDRCYEGFSTLQAVKLWHMAKNEDDIADLNSLWYLTLMKNGCYNYLKMGINGIIQAIILSIGGLKFSNHHLELNLNPKQLHRNYMFRNINYSNLTYFNISIEVDDDDNHAKLYVTMDSFKKDFYACDAGCIDEPINLISKIKHEFPVKMTNPVTAILYITDDKIHVSQLKHILHVQEVEIAPPQDVNSVALHKHGHHLAGLSILFWALFVFLILVFHLFLCKLIFRELFRSSNDDSGSQSYNNNRYLRTRAV